jgi:hypothetical protein
MRFALVNECTVPEVTPHLMVQWAVALSEQATRDLSTLWEVSASEVVFFTSMLNVPTLKNEPYSITHLVDYIPEAPKALAYHTVDLLGRPVLKIGVRTTLENGGSLEDVSVAISHEVLETIGDAYCSFYALWSDGSRFVSLEICDPVEGDTYSKDGVELSNFVGPRWFDQGGAGPYDYMRKLHAPFTLSAGGYVAFADGSQEYGERMSESKKAHKKLRGRRVATRVT